MRTTNRKVLMNHKNDDSTTRCFSINKRAHRNVAKTRTRVMRQLPSSQQLYQVMFNNRFSRGTARNVEIQFNNNDVGMTRPSFSSLQCSHSEDDGDCHDSGQTKLVQAKQHDTDINSLWWPWQRKAVSSSKWRIKSYRRRVGVGQECYNKVRDAALDWEFNNCNFDKTNEGGKEMDKSDGPTTGIILAIPSSTNEMINGIPENTSSNVIQIWSPNGSSIDSCVESARARKLATYTKINILKRFQGLPLSLPSISFYALNPVAVVYDILDQRAPATSSYAGNSSHKYGSTFTSTAYGTLKGHLLCGEERVTVILRDEEEREGKSYVNTSFGQSNKRSRRSAKNTPPSLPKSSLSTRNTGGFVDIEIISYSKAAPSLFGQIVWPFISKKQDDFFQCELDSLEKVAIQSTR